MFSAWVWEDHFLQCLYFWKFMVRKWAAALCFLHFLYQSTFVTCSCSSLLKNAKEWMFRVPKFSCAACGTQRILYLLNALPTALLVVQPLWLLLGNWQKPPWVVTDEKLCGRISSDNLFSVHLVFTLRKVLFHHADGWWTASGLTVRLTFQNAWFV